jgi:hypothetical protein
MKRISQAEARSETEKDDDGEEEEFLSYQFDESVTVVTDSSKCIGSFCLEPLGTNKEGNFTEPNSFQVLLSLSKKLNYTFKRHEKQSTQRWERNQFVQEEKDQVTQTENGRVKTERQVEETQSLKRGE